MVYYWCPSYYLKTHTLTHAIHTQKHAHKNTPTHPLFSSLLDLIETLLVAILRRFFRPHIRTKTLEDEYINLLTETKIIVSESICFIFSIKERLSLGTPILYVVANVQKCTPEMEMKSYVIWKPTHHR